MPTWRDSLRPEKKIHHYHWVPGTAAWVFSLGLVISIVVVLRAYDGKPLSEWKSSISINASIAILVTLLYISSTKSISICLGQLKWNHFQKPRPLYDLELLDSAGRSTFGSMHMLLRGPRK